MSEAIVFLQPKHNGPVRWPDILNGAETYNDMNDLYGDHISADKMHSLYIFDDNDYKIEKDKNGFSLNELKFLNDWNEQLSEKVRDEIQETIEELEGGTWV